MLNLLLMTAIRILMLNPYRFRAQAINLLRKIFLKKIASYRIKILNFFMLLPNLTMKTMLQKAHHILK